MIVGNSAFSEWSLLVFLRDAEDETIEYHIQNVLDSLAYSLLQDLLRKKMRVQSEPRPEPSGHRAWQAVPFEGSGRDLPQMASVTIQEGFPGKIIQHFSQERVPKSALLLCIPNLPLSLSIIPVKRKAECRSVFVSENFFTDLFSQCLI